MLQVAVNKRDPVNQGMYRLNDELYGNKMLEKRGNELNDLLNNPPLGSVSRHVQSLDNKYVYSMTRTASANDSTAGASSASVEYWLHKSPTSTYLLWEDSCDWPIHRTSR